MARAPRTRAPALAALALTATLALPGGATVAEESPEDIEDALSTVRVELAEVRGELDDLHAAADDAIAEYTRQSERLTTATEAQRAAEGRAERADDVFRESRSAARDLAVSAYQGHDLGLVHAVVGADGPRDVLDRASVLHLLGDRRAAVVDRDDATRLVATTLSDRADDARAERQDTADAAAEARDDAVAAVSAKEDAMTDLLTRQDELERRLHAAEDNPEGAAERRRQALSLAETAAGEDPEATQEVGDATEEAEERDDASGEVAAEPEPDDGADSCTGGDVSGHANGEIPESALCPLPQAGERLRADAAAAFIRLDEEFHAEFGRPMCVADSYRPLDEQVRLFHEMEAGKAASPGTSAHGLGIAVDLCGGVQDHESPEYRWMMDHAPDHGWHNPEWAHDGFEPWHWEYTG